MKKNGGMYNFEEINFENEWKINYKDSGVKKAYIINDKSLSSRTSYVYDQKGSSHEKKFLESFQNDTDWVHICYLDDYECYEDLKNLSIPFSVDFCTTKNRESFMDIMKKAEIIFDSRERKGLYEGLDMNTKLILHDEYGVEVIKNGKIISKIDNIPTKGLSVNGAGDIFAGNFIKHYISTDAITASKKSMRETTNLLIKRKK